MISGDFISRILINQEYVTVLVKVDHIRRYLVALLTEQSQRTDAIYQVLFHLSPWQTAAFYLSLSDLEIL